MRKFAAIAVSMALLVGLSACSEVAPQDKVGLWITAGQKEGNKFDHCIPPGAVDDVAINDNTYWVEDNLRTWNAAPGSKDTDVPLTVLAKPDEGSTTGLQVDVWTQTNFKLNTYCGADEKDANAPLPQWWKNLGDRYDADTPEGWREMLLNTVVPAQDKARNVLRDYTSTELVSGSVWAQAEKQFAQVFTDELKRLTGADYFCGPTFNRKSSDCPQIALSIKDAELTDKGVQQARNDKQKALEQAQAAVAEAEGKVKAAEAQEQLYSNSAWMELEKAKIDLEKARACGTASNCTIIITAEGVQVHTK